MDADDIVVCRVTDSETGRWIEIFRQVQCENPLQRFGLDLHIELNGKYSHLGTLRDPFLEIVPSKESMRKTWAIGGIIYPIFCLNDKGLSFSLKPQHCFYHCSLNKYWAGWAFMTPEEVHGDRDLGRKNLEAAINELNAYVSDEVYGFECYDACGHKVADGENFFNVYDNWGKFMEVIASSVPDDYKQMARNCTFGKHDPIIRCVPDFVRNNMRHNPSDKLIDVYGKKYTELEIKNCYKFWHDKMEEQAIDEAICHALDCLDDPKVTKYADSHHDELIEEYRFQLHENLTAYALYNYVTNDLAKRINPDWEPMQD